MKRSPLILTAALTLGLIFGNAKAETVDRIAAKVGSDIITQSDISETLGFKKKVFNLKFEAPEASRRWQIWQKDTLNELILETILKQKINSEGITVAPSELEAAYQAQWQGTVGSEKAWSDKLQKIGLTPAEYKDELRFDIQKQRFVQKNILPKITLPDTQLQEAYEKQKNEFLTFGKYRFIEVLLVQSQFANEAEFKKIAQNIHGGLKNNSAGAGESIQKFSSGAFKNSRGDSGLMAARDINPEIKALLDRLKTGETSQIFFNNGQAYIFKLLQKTEPQPLPYADVAPTLKMQLMQTSAEAELRKYLLGEKDRTYIEIVKTQ